MHCSRGSWTAYGRLSDSDALDAHVSVQARLHEIWGICSVAQYHQMTLSVREDLLELQNLTLVL